MQKIRDSYRWYKIKQFVKPLRDDLIMGFAESWRMLFRWCLPITFAAYIFNHI